MSFEYVKKIPKPEKILLELPLNKDLVELKKKRDNEIKDVFENKDDRFLVIIGPCSADNEDAVCDYIARLSKVQDKVKDKLIIIPRIYTNKPRTTGKGYKGMAHQPDPLEKPNMVEGIKAIRKMHIRAMKESGLTAADEMLYPGNYPYLEDILSYVAIGARSVENQQHRLTVSGLDIPIGMKNPISGDINVMINSIIAAQFGHTFIYNGWEVKTSGNPLVHGILRGALDHQGRSIPNYHYEDLIEAVRKYLSKELFNPSIIVDTNHSNSDKNFIEQPRIAMEVLYSVKKSDFLKGIVKGMMIESYLSEGAQNTTGTIFGKSITDPCLGWEASERLLYDIAERV